MYKTFGTYSFLGMLAPSLRPVPFTGVEWSYQAKELGYDEKGEMVKRIYDEEDQIDEEDSGEQETEMVEIIKQDSGPKLTAQSSDSTLDSLDKEILI